MQPVIESGGPNGDRAVQDHDATEATQAPEAPLPGESSRERLHRHGRRARLYFWSLLLVLTLVAIIALVVSNTRQVRVSWVFGHSHTSLVWLVVAPAVIGWLAGVATAIVFRRRTRAPRR